MNIEVLDQRLLKANTTHALLYRSNENVIRSNEKTKKKHRHFKQLFSTNFYAENVKSVSVFMHGNNVSLKVYGF